MNIKIKRKKKLIALFLLVILILAGTTGCAQLADPIQGSIEIGQGPESSLEPGLEMTNTASPIPPESIPPETETSKIPTKSPQGGSSRKGEQSSYRSIIELVVRDLALRLKLDRDQIQVLSIESVEWVDAGLGCPLPGMGYAQVVTPGYRVTLEAEGDAYLYHTDTKQVFVLCREGDPALPVIPVDPDEIQDGVPWMPVDPLPTLIEGKDAEDPEPIK